MRTGFYPRRRIVGFFAAGIYFLFLSVSCAEYPPAEGKRTSEAPFVAEELIVKFKEGAVEKTESGELDFKSESLQKLFETFPAREIEPVFRNAPFHSPLGRTFKIVFPSLTDVRKAQQAFAQDPSVEYAEPNYIYHTQNS